MSHGVTSPVEYGGIRRTAVRPARLVVAAWAALFAIYPWGHSSLFLAGLLGVILWDKARASAAVDAGLRARQRPVSAAIALFWLYALWATLTGFAATHPLPAVGGGLAMAVMATMIAVLGPMLAERDGLLLRWLVPIALVSAGGSALYAVVWFFATDAWRAEGLFAGPNGLGAIMALVLNLGIGYVIESRARDSARGGTYGVPAEPRPANSAAGVWWVWLPVLASIGAGLVLSGSRGALLGMVVSLGIWVATGNRAVRAVAAMLVIAMVVVGSLSPFLMGRFAAAFDLRRNSDRILLWTTALRMWESAPITGVGTGNFGLVFDEYLPPGESRGDTPASPHNLLLKALTEHGIVGAGLLVAFLAMAGVAAMRLLRRRTPLWTGVVAAVAGALVHEMFDHIVTSFEAGSLFWILLGAVIYAGYQGQGDQVSRGTGVGHPDLKVASYQGASGGVAGRAGGGAGRSA